jgi:nicotinamidase/pyrazinamidase
VQAPAWPGPERGSVKRLLWDVDTQIDFVHADGKLAVPDATRAVPAMARLVEAARAAGIPHVASADDHELTDSEICESPDYLTTYPPHCLRGTRGAEKVQETRQDDPVPLALTVVPDRWLHGREFLLLKKSFDVFTNPNAERLLELLDPDEIVLFGVATDVCDDAAIRGFLARGRSVTFVEEASRGLDDTRTAACMAAWRESGVRFASVDDVIAEL